MRNSCDLFGIDKKEIPADAAIAGAWEVDGRAMYFVYRRLQEFRKQGR
ncbi:MAG: hypothetical protein V2J25_08225 [Desulfatiglans sp.]|nr:hypothetical protein [Thermodesulfobacteriota bacterium]MEE4352840.1 hypothetical protein [Desulfatiglans sp.]